jgi:hypothetical protein
MGLLGKLLGGRQDAAPDDGWQPDGTGVVSAGDIGGDIQAGNSYSLRYVRADMPGSLITVSYYGAEYDECPGEFIVQRQVEWMVCEDPADPGGTEIWSDVAYDDVTEMYLDTAGEADAEARQCVEEDAADGSGYFGWDGQPDSPGES